MPSNLTTILSTSLGDIRLNLFPELTPLTVANFVDLALGRKEWTNPTTGAKQRTPLYDGTIFHRVIAGFMIQGGDPLGRGTGGPGYRFGDELHNDLTFATAYKLAMANAGPGTNGSQFFITVAPTNWLTGKHTIFGEVSDAGSRAVVDRISNVPTGPMDRPVDDVVIRRVAVGEEMTTELAIAPVDGRLRLVSILADGSAEFVDPHRRLHSLLYIWSMEALELESQIAEFEDLINTRDVREGQLQDFLSRNPGFLAGAEYQAAHPHLVLRRETGGDLIPDFALQPHGSENLCDLLELKLPRAKIVVGSSSRPRLSASVMEARAQLAEYRDYFESPQNRKVVENAYGLKFFRPRMHVVIGRRTTVNPLELRKAESDVPDLRLTTYDDLGERAKTMLTAMRTMRGQVLR